jgi:hypothetical protein
MHDASKTAIHVAHVVGPPVLTPGAARALLRILQREAARRAADTATGPEPQNREVLAS